VKPKVNQPSQNRRKILQGTLAAPMVLTVSSPTAAMVTSHMKCMANITQPTTGELPGLFFLTEQQYLNPADTWLREQIRVKLFRHNANNEGWFFNDPIAGWVNVSNLTLLPNGWHGVNGVAEQTRWALVWVDSRSGQKIRVSLQRPTEAQFTTESCNTSVRPAAG
jgi:hypothetical protein